MTPLKFVEQMRSQIGQLEQRLDWDSYFICMAVLAAARSPSDRAHVGCVLVIDRRIVSTGYNGFLSGLPHEALISDGHEINTVHAEQNAVADAARRGTPICGATAYVTHYPCLNCAKSLAAAGITRVVFLQHYRDTRDSDGLFDAAGIETLWFGGHA